jgi:adenine deaminase
MALLVIPRLKLSDHGLFDGTAFAFTSVQPDSEPAPA